VIVPKEFVGTIMELAQERRGEYDHMEYLSPERVHLTYEMPLGEHYKALVNGQAAYTGRNLATQSITSPAENTYLNARTLVNASLTLAEVHDKYYVRFVGRNLTDKRYLTAAQVVGGLWADGQYGAPRYFGAEFGFKFGN